MIDKDFTITDDIAAAEIFLKRAEAGLMKVDSSSARSILRNVHDTITRIQDLRWTIWIHDGIEDKCENPDTVYTSGASLIASMMEVEEHRETDRVNDDV